MTLTETESQPDGKSRDQERLLIFRIGQIGDTIAALPSLWALRKQYPRAKIVLLNEIPISQKHLPPDAVLPATGLVDGFEQYPAGASLKNLPQAWRQIRNLSNQGFDTLVYLVPSSRTEKQRLRDLMFFRVCGMRRFLGTSGFSGNPQMRKSDGFLVPLPKEADALMGRLTLDGLPVPAANAGCMDLRLTDAEKTKADAWWSYKMSSQPRPRSWIAICASGKASVQLWPDKNYVEVVKRLVKQYAVFPVIVGGKQDQELARQMVAQWGAGLSAAGELTVRESAALMTDARFYLGNNTGVMHLAAAVGTPCVAVSTGRDWPGIWEPYGAGHKVLRHEVACTGCRLDVCNQNLQCLSGISVETVFNACSEVIERGSRTS